MTDGLHEFAEPHYHVAPKHITLYNSVKASPNKRVSKDDDQGLNSNSVKAFGLSLQKRWWWPVVTPCKPGPGGSHEDEHICEQDGLEDE